MKIIHPTRLIIIIFSFFLSVHSVHLQAQRLDGIFCKQVGKESNIPKEHYRVIIDDRGRIITSNLFGLAVFDGVKWKKEIIRDSINALRVIYFLKKSKFEDKKLIIVSDDALGFLKIKNGEKKIKKIADKLVINSTIGRIVREVIQKNDKTYFIGNKGFIVYNHKSKQTTLHPNIAPINHVDAVFLIKSRIVLKERGGDIYMLNENKWTISKDYSFLQKYNTYQMKRVSNEHMLLIGRSGDVIFYNTEKQTFIKHKNLSLFFNGSAAFDIKINKNKAYIKSYDRVLIYDLGLKKILFKKKFPKIRIIDFALDTQGNFWLSSFDGIFFIETNTVFKTRDNTKNTNALHYIDKYTFDIKKSLSKLEVTIDNESNSVSHDGLGQIFQVIKAFNDIYICTFTGLYKFNKQTLKFDKLVEGKCEYVTANQQNNWLYVFQGNKLLILDENNKVLKTHTIKGVVTDVIWFNNSIFYSTDDAVFRIDFNQKLNQVSQITKLNFPHKTLFGFGFFVQSGDLFITNSFALFKISKKDKSKIQVFTKDVINLKKNKKGKYLLSFANTHPVGKGRFFVVPMYVGEYGGENRPGYLTSKNNKLIWYNKPFKRLGKYQMESLAKTPRNTYEFITNDHIIEYDPNKKVNTDYAFKAYIRSAQVKVKQVDTVSRKEALRDSTIYYGNLASPSTITLPYPQNTLTFTYASDSWAAYERNLYSYQLTGLDEGWSNWSTEQKKEYTHLREGTYIFKVRCKNVYGTISSVDSYTFTILPPWHRTTWAYTLYILAGLALLVGGSYGYSRYRSRQLYRRNQLLEQEVAERTEEILAQKEEITQQADMLKTSNDDLKKANEKLQQVNQIIKTESDKKVGIYAQEVTDAMIKLEQVREVFNSSGAETAKRMLNVELNTTGKLAAIREKVSEAFPEFVVELDKALTSKQINKTIWQVAHCLKLGMKPKEIAEILPVQARSVSTFGSKLRKLGLLTKEG